MSTIPRLLLVVCASSVALAFSSGATAAPVEEPPPHESGATSSDATPPPKPQSTDAEAGKSTANKPAKLVLVDDTLTDDQLKQILARGYKPESQASGNEVFYCRRERALGTRFETKTCKTAQRILQDETQGKDMTSKAQRPTGNPAQ